MANPMLDATLHDEVFLERASAARPPVLVVDADPGCVSQCALMLEELGYEYRSASTAREALEHMVRDPMIQILLVDVQIPSIGGFMLIDEARACASRNRPIAAIMMSDAVSAEVAVQGLHIEAVDLLSKPLGLDAFSTALRRTLRYLSARQMDADGASMSNMMQQLSRLVAELEYKAVEPRTEEIVGDKEISAALRVIIASRGLRTRFFPGQLFADPAWDILLDLTRAKLEKQQVSVSSVCIAASVPMSTALRWVRQMIDAGLLLRWTDPKDRRRDLIALTDAATGHMRDYLSSVYSTMKRL